MPSSAALRVRLASSVALALLASAATARAAVSPHLSEEWLPSSNGMAAIAWDREQYKLVQFLEHPYASASSTASTRNFAYDSYPGVRVAGTGTWLSSVAPTLVEYVAGTGIVHSQRTLGNLTLDEYDFAPMGLSEYASLMLVEVTQAGAPAAVDAYSLFNYHLGSGNPPGTDSESITYDATRDAYTETGPSGVAMAYASLLPSSFHGASTSGASENPYDLLLAGDDLGDDAATGVTTDAVAGFQSALGSPAKGSSTWTGWLTVLAPDADGSGAVNRVRAWINGRTPQRLLTDETAGWKSWLTPAPKGSSALEAALDQESQVMLRMGQVTEPGPAAGQILASIAPGQWNIAWVRDMAYSVVALVEGGHYAEAKAAIAFQLAAQSGTYQAEVGAPYQISVCRYYGGGTEWSDSNSDGPNIEFDGFGLFLWELESYVKASGDKASLAAWWPAVKPLVADVLAGLQESTGLISADSSIWEVHWDGQQKHFAYTTITAASGLCNASALATLAGDGASTSKYLAAGQKARDALLPNLRAADGALAQSTEALAAGSGWLDASVVEAINFGLVDPGLHTAGQTLADMEAGLVPQSGRGFMRSDAGDSYSSNEWVFIDLRTARSLELQGSAGYAASLFAWNVAQASDNYGELSELHDPVTADYAGQAPMVGFGAGAYVLRLTERGSPVTPACGAFAKEAGNAPDAGADSGSDSGADSGADSGSDSGAVADSGADADAGAVADSDAGSGAGSVGDTDAGATPGSSHSGCSCRLGPDPANALAWLGLVPLALVFVRRRSR